jgi:glycerate-2-kinase
LGLESPEVFLDRNNAYEYFKSLGDLIVTGATSSNVGDLQVVLVTE